MEFGYFTLSDNRYRDNPRSANQYISDIADQAAYADTLGMHSAWLGEHHFDTLGVLSCPDIVLAHVAARTKHIRLAPAVTVLPLHHPIRVAEQWATLDLLSGGRVDFAAGRGFDKDEYEVLGANFEDNRSIFEESLDIILRLWDANGPISHHGKHYRFDNIVTTPKPVQKPLPTYVAAFSQPSIELAARLGCGVIVAPFAAVMNFGGLKQVGDLYREACTRYGTAPKRLMCSYFTHIADTPEQERAQRERQIRYFRECALPAMHIHKNYAYHTPMMERLRTIEPDQLGSGALLVGSPARIIDTLKTVEDAGFSEVILYINVGLKPHQQVKDEMARFMADVAPAFDGAHKRRVA